MTMNNINMYVLMSHYGVSSCGRFSIAPIEKAKSEELLLWYIGVRDLNSVFFCFVLVLPNTRLRKLYFHTY